MNNIEQYTEIQTNLEILAEECGEAIQIKSKIMQFGLKDFHKKKGLPNKEKLEQKIGHILAMVEILIMNKVLTGKGVITGKHHKFNKLAEGYGPLMAWDDLQDQIK